MSLVAAALAGLAVLAKGLIGLVLPGAVLFIWLVAGKRWRGLKALVWPPALLLFAAVAVPWFWLMQTRFSGFTIISSSTSTSSASPRPGSTTPSRSGSTCR